MSRDRDEAVSRAAVVRQQMSADDIPAASAADTRDCSRTDPQRAVQQTTDIAYSEDMYIEHSDGGIQHHTDTR